MLGSHRGKTAFSIFERYCLKTWLTQYATKIDEHNAYFSFKDLDTYFNHIINSLSVVEKKCVIAWFQAFNQEEKPNPRKVDLYLWPSVYLVGMKTV